MLCLTVLTIPVQTWAAAPSACEGLRAKYPDLKGKTIVDAINPHTPGYEALDPQDPSKYVGFDVDLAEALGECLGFKVTYKPVAFAALLPTLRSGQADIVISDIYATEERAKAADFITYSKVFDGVLVAKGRAVQRCWVGRIGSVPPHLRCEVKRLVARGIPDPANV